MPPIENIPGQGPILLTCEHASQRLPDGYTWGEDERLVGTHWAFDLGAAELTRDLASALGAPAVLSNFSRLLVDPNRPEDSPTLFREVAEGEHVHLNRELEAADRDHRLHHFYRPYHDAVSQLMSRSPAALAFSVHSFTPVYEGSRRELEIGVLYDESEEMAAEMVGMLSDAGFRAAPNEPYSGKEGLMYCVDKHARVHGKHAIEIEVRQDLATHAETRAHIVQTLLTILGRLG